MEDKNAAGRLYVVATPLGNLDDITFRAVELLRKVEVIACEDTRHSRKLFSHYGIGARLVSCHEHNEQKAAARLLDLLESGTDVALVSDAGTPTVSDPGYRVVALAAERGIEVLTVPGPSAVTAALSISGLPTDSFMFAGFVPPRESELKRKLAELAELSCTLVFFCPARKVGRVLETFASVLGGRRSAAACRELTKVHEEVVRGTLAGIADELKERKNVRGELVLLVEGRGRLDEQEETEEGDLETRLAGLIAGLDDPAALGARRLTALAADELGEPRNRIYPLICAYLNRVKED